MNTIVLLLTIAGAIFLFYLIFPFLTVLFSRLVTERVPPDPHPKAQLHPVDFACIITAYRNCEIAKGLITSLLRQSHPHFHIYLVADACDVSGFDVSHPQFTLLKPAPDLNLKVKSIIYAVERFVRPHEYIVIFDADNLAHPQLLSIFNRYAREGYMAIQGQRTAKNTDTKFAAADSLGELYKNYIERYVTYLLGSSAVISGSGMAVEASVYKAYLYSPEIEKGKHLWKKMLQEDKILQNFLLRQDIQIAYAKTAITYDEKVTTADAVETQRSRWLFSYFQNMPNALGIFRRGLLNGSWNQFYFGLVTLAPPLFILLGAAMLIAFLGIWLQPMLSVGMVMGLVLFVATILWTLQLSNAPREVWQSILTSVPTFVWRQVRALFKMANPNKNFKHTEHTVKVNIDEVLQKSPEG